METRVVDLNGLPGLDGATEVEVLFAGRRVRMLNRNGLKGSFDLTQKGNQSWGAIQGDPLREQYEIPVIDLDQNPEYQDADVVVVRYGGSVVSIPSDPTKWVVDGEPAEFGDVVSKYLDQREKRCGKNPLMKPD